MPNPFDFGLTVEPELITDIEWSDYWFCRNADGGFFYDARPEEGIGPLGLGVFQLALWHALAEQQTKNLR